MKQWTIQDIVDDLIGPVHAVGETRTDEKRLENLKELIELSEYIIGQISDAADDHDRVEYSMKKIGETAKQYLDDLQKDESLVK